MSQCVQLHFNSVVFLIYFQVQHKQIHRLYISALLPRTRLQLCKFNSFKHLTNAACSHLKWKAKYYLFISVLLLLLSFLLLREVFINLIKLRDTETTFVASFHIWLLVYAFQEFYRSENELSMRLKTSRIGFSIVIHLSVCCDVMIMIDFVFSMLNV